MCSRRVHPAHSSIPPRAIVSRVLRERTARRARASVRPVPRAHLALGTRRPVRCAQLEHMPTSKEAHPAFPAPLEPSALPGPTRASHALPGPSPTRSLDLNACRARLDRSVREAVDTAPCVRREHSAPAMLRHAPYVRRVPLAVRDRPRTLHAPRDPTTPFPARAGASRAPPARSRVWRERHLAVPAALDSTLWESDGSGECTRCSGGSYSPVGASSSEQCQPSLTGGANTCEMAGNTCPNTGGVGPSQIAAALRRRGPRATTCPGTQRSCPVYGYTYSGRGYLKAYECVEVQKDLESCGGCVANDSPFGEKTANGGRDCSAIPYVDSVTCQRGSCVIERCTSGYAVSTDGQRCVQSLRLQTRDGF
ncbi:hypothetical protein C8T65DRAFT_5528 [Cerioporus squamosus]|nr:hypothetical protein C8T65DRAFT_5528 [Cerioporus squamosus]